MLDFIAVWFYHDSSLLFHGTVLDFHGDTHQADEQVAPMVKFDSESGDSGIKRPPCSKLLWVIRTAISTVSTPKRVDRMARQVWAASRCRVKRAAIGKRRRLD